MGSSLVQIPADDALGDDLEAGLQGGDRAAQQATGPVGQLQGRDLKAEADLLIKPRPQDY